MSPINPLVLQRRHAELGRIRLGDRGGKGQPQKLTTFRVTSPSRRHIDDIAVLYGGNPRPWNGSGRDEYEVYTDATSIPVLVVRGGITQHMETWSGGGCVHRCDGVTSADTGAPCDPDDPQHAAAKPTTRLSVMLRELEAIGVWRLESHGWHAAAELPGLVELATLVGELVPASLYLAERRVIRDGRTSRFVVPGLDLEVTPGRLAAIVTAQPTPPVASERPEPVGAPAAAPAITTAPAGRDWEGELAAVATYQEAQELWHAAGRAGALTDQLKAAITERGRALTNPTPPTDAPPAAGDTAGDADDVWFQIVAAAGRQGMSTADVDQDFEAHSGVQAGAASAGQLRAYLDHLRNTPTPPAAGG